MANASQVMVDLETMGKNSNSAIISIGACKFDLNGDTIGEKFHLVVDLESSIRTGGVMDASTVMWWMQQSDAARAVFSAKRTYDTNTALGEFTAWFGSKSLPTWGNGATFDNVILRNAYARVGLAPPWAYWDDRCYRTMKNMAPSVPLAKQGVAHNALDDAIQQAMHLQAITKHLGVKA